MRLVDADALKEDCRMANDCKDCKTNVRACNYDYVYTKKDFCGWLDDAPTVDAVPIAWVEELIKQWRDENNAFSVIATTVLMTMIRKWKDGEQT